MIVEKLYISILNFIYKHTSGLSQRTRSILMYSCLTIIIVSTYFYQAKRFFSIRLSGHAEQFYRHMRIYRISYCQY